jgi:multidrug efflux pump subunit AcrA (membrane-fusion protein)
VGPDGSTRISWGDFKATITESGELRAVNSKMINMPDFDWAYGKRKILDMLEEGTFVKKGQYIAQIDTSNDVRILKETRSNLAISLVDYEKLLIEQKSTFRQLESDLLLAQASLRLASVDTQSVQFESKAKRERSRLEYKMFRLEVEKLTAKLNYTKLIQKEDRVILEAKIANHKRAINNAIDTINRFTLLAPANGMIEYLRIGRPRRKISIGDELWPGEPIIGLPDLSQMKVAMNIGETDIYKIEVGQTASVRLDAFPKKSFPGTIISISKICGYKDEDEADLKVFDVEVLLEGTDAILKPGMTVGCEIAIADLRDVYFVHLSYVQEELSGFVIYIMRESQERSVPVKLGPRNAKQIVVYGDFSKSDLLIQPDKKEQAL